MEEIEQSKKRFEELDCQISSCGTLASTHITSVVEGINAAYEEKLQQATDKERDEIRIINEETDEEVRIINEKRNKRIRNCKAEAGRRQQAIMEKLAKVLSDTTEINVMVSKKINELKHKNRRQIDTIDKLISEMSRIREDDDELMKETRPRILAAIDERWRENASDDVEECSNRIKNEVQGIRFVEGEMGGEHYARIDGYAGKWELVKSIDLPPVIEYPRVCGVIGGDEICLRNWQNSDLYVTDMSSGNTKKVVEGVDVSVTSCASVGKGMVVCGKRRDHCTGRTLDGCITLYNEEWKVVKDISIPRDASANSQVYIDVDRDGLILAAQYGQSNIFIIDPSNGDVLKRVAMAGKVVRGEIEASPSGDIVVKTGYGEFVVISRGGEEKAVICDEEWSKTGWSKCRVDKLTGALFITYWDSRRSVCTIDEVSTDDSSKKINIIEYVESHQSYLPRPFAISPSGKMFTCDQNHMYVYEKSFMAFIV